MINFYFSDEYLNHDTGSHPESIQRIKTVKQLLNDKYNNHNFIEPSKASTDLISNVHDKDYVEEILMNIPKSGFYHFDPDTIVIGGGAIGLAAALALQAQGADEVTIVEPNDARRAFLVDHCGQSAVSSADGSPAIVIDAVGFAVTRASASACVRPGGVIAHVGLGDSDGGLDIRRITLQEITVIGTYTYTAQDFVDTAHALFDGRLGDCEWTEVRSLADGAAAFQDIRAGRVAAPKIILKP